MSEAKSTTDHDAIRTWVEQRGGRPARVREHQERGRSGGLLRVDFGDPDANLEEISWEEFFDAFDANGLAFLHQDRTAQGQPSRFNKFVSRQDGE